VQGGKKKVKIASVTVVYNEYHKLENWLGYYKKYSGDLAMHIIVDNGSEEDFKKELEMRFPESVLVWRSENGGTTNAYNDGVRVALDNNEIEAILIIDGDVELQEGCLDKLAGYLQSDETLGVAAPVLLKANSSIVENCGATITSFFEYKQNNYNETLESLKFDNKYVDTVGWGINLAKRSVYENIGLLDETMFMYYEEVDMGIRVKEKGIRMGINRNAVAWHQHVNKSGSADRAPYAYYLFSRNNLYLCQKYGRFVIAALRFIWYIAFALLMLAKRTLFLQFKRLKAPLYMMAGACKGVKGNMARNKYFG
jgi:GT2 family glycosyltransferase